MRTCRYWHNYGKGSLCPYGKGSLSPIKNAFYEFMEQFHSYTVGTRHVGTSEIIIILIMEVKEVKEYTKVLVWDQNKCPE